MGSARKPKLIVMAFRRGLTLLSLTTFKSNIQQACTMHKKVQHTFTCLVNFVGKTRLTVSSPIHCMYWEWNPMTFWQNFHNWGSIESVSVKVCVCLEIPPCHLKAKHHF